MEHGNQVPALRAAEIRYGIAFTTSPTTIVRARPVCFSVGRNGSITFRIGEVRLRGSEWVVRLRTLRHQT
jgi:hypothetical protein